MVHVMAGCFFRQNETVKCRKRKQLRPLAGYVHLVFAGLSSFHDWADNFPWHDDHEFFSVLYETRGIMHVLLFDIVSSSSHELLASQICTTKLYFILLFGIIIDLLCHIRKSYLPLVYSGICMVVRYGSQLLSMCAEMLACKVPVGSRRPGL